MTAKITKPNKTDRLDKMLGQPDSATLAAICQTNRSQTHSARAPICRLRRRGITIKPARDADDPHRVYQIGETAPARAADQ